MSLFYIAKKYADTPSDIDAMTAFIDALAQEKLIEEIRTILSLDFERIAGPSLTRLTELLPEDVDLLLSIALWKYHFGLDEEAQDYVERSKRIAPLDLRVLQVELFLSYGNEPGYLLSLCAAALAVYPNDEWILTIKRRIEQTGQLTELNGPPLNLSWQKSLSDVP